jgi:hypothetical protein
MKGDFSRDTFDPLKHFTRVLMQQGRVQLDADWNEQTALLWHYIRALSADLIGPHGGPDGLCGFRILTHDMLNTSCGHDTPETVGENVLYPLTLPGNFMIGTGRYYVGGLLCENERMALYAPVKSAPGYDQRDYLADEFTVEGDFFIYLDAWEEHVTSFDDEAIREVALGSQGPDTTTRARVAWQVRAVAVADMPDFGTPNCLTIANNPAWLALVSGLQPENRGRLRAKAEEPEDPDSFEPCLVSPDARFRGAENQLYRVEIHRGGTVSKSEPATFKWSRENGSVVLPVRSVSGKVVTLDQMGRDARSGVEIGDWVEVYDRDSARVEGQTPLVQVVDVNYVEIKPMPAVFDNKYVTRITARTSRRARPSAISPSSCARTSATSSRRTSATAMRYAYAAIMEGVPYANGAPNLTVDIPALLELAQKNGVPISARTSRPARR